MEIEQEQELQSTVVTRTVTKNVFLRFNVPDNGSCLFWAVAMAYLVPVRNNDSLFKERFETLFNSTGKNHVRHVQKLLLKLPLNSAYEDEILSELVTNVFRNRVVDEVTKQKEEVYQSVTLDDIIYMKNDAFIVDGTISEQFRTKFPSQTQLIDLNRLKPDRLYDKSIKLMNTELDKVSEKDKVQRFKFYMYCESMRSSCAWGGEREIRAIQQLLKCSVSVFNDNITNEKICFSSLNICLFKSNEVHYEFCLVKPQVIIKAMTSLDYKLALTLVKIGVSDVNYLYHNDWTLLHFAALTNDYNGIIERLVSQGADLSSATKSGHTPLQMAAYFEQKKAIASLKTLARVNTFNNLNMHKIEREESIEKSEIQTSINTIMGKNQPNSINVLFFDYGSQYPVLMANESSPKEAHKSPIHVGCFTKSFKYVFNLIVEKINISVDYFHIKVKWKANTMLEFSNWSPLHYATEKGNLNAVKTLVQIGKAEVDVRDHDGGTPLQRAVKLGHVRVVMYLIEIGADINSVDQLKMTAVHHAVKCGGWNAVQCLVGHKADLNIADDKNKTPLYSAIQSRKWDMIQRLLENGALLRGISIKQKQNIYQTLIKNVNKNQQFSRAISLGNVELLKKLISESKGSLDEHLLKAYHKLKLMNVTLTPNICWFIESILIDACYFSEDQKSEEKPNQDGNLSKIKLRIDLVLRCVDDMNNYLRENGFEVDDTFLFMGKFLAKNMHILKGQLRSTYEVLPWEEMHFYLITFLLSYTEPDQVDAVSYLVLHTKKVMKYLRVFKNLLLKVDIENSLKMRKTKIKNRSDVKENIITCNPEFKELFIDFEHLKDVHSLNRIERYVKVACSADLIKSSLIGQLTIERALQVTGECLKNTVQSPNLSEKTSDLLLTFAPKNVKSIVTVLRDSLTHAKTLLKIENVKKSKNLDYYKIQNDLKKLLPEMTYIRFRKKCLVVKSFLEYIIASENIDDIFVDTREVRLNDICNLDSLSNESFGKIDSYFQKFKNLLKDQTDFQQECIETINNFVNQEKKNKVIKSRHEKYWHGTEDFIHFFISKDSLGNIQRRARCVLNSYLIANEKEDFHNNSRQIFGAIVNLKTSIEHNDEAKQILDVISVMIKLDAERISRIDELNESLNKKSHQIIWDILSQLDEHILSFINEISDDKDVRIKLRKEYRSKKDVYEAKMTLMEFYSKQTDSISDQKMFENLMTKVKFKLRKSESMTSLYKEKDPEKRKYLLKRVKRKRTDDSYKKLVDSLADASDLNNKILKFIKSFESFKYVLLDLNVDRSTYLKAFLFEKIETLEKALLNVETDSDLLNMLQTKIEFQIAIEMLMLTIAETLETLNMFETNGTFLDENVPVLIGKNLRNYLAHGDLLIDLLSIDHLKSIVYHIRSIRNHCSKTNNTVYNGIKRIGTKTIKEIAKLEQGYQNSLKLIKKQKQLIKAVRDNKLESIKSILNNELVFKCRSFSGWTLLFYAAETDNLEVFVYLFKNSVNIYYKDKFNNSILNYLAKFGSLKIIKHLIKNKVIYPTNCTLNLGKFLVHVSSEFGQLEVTNYLLRNGVDPNVENDFGATPLYSAVLNNRIDVVSSLIKFEANINIIILGLPILHFAAASGCAEIIQMLIDKKLDVDPKIASLQTPLHIACHYGHNNVVEVLLKNKANINAAAEYDKTPLYYAALQGHEKVVTCLLAKGALTNPLTIINETALHVAALYGHVHVVQLLLSNGADAHAKTEDGMTPLHFASRLDHCDVVKLLLDGDVTDVNVESIDGFTPLHLASGNGSAELILTLLKNGANINYYNKYGQTPMHSAVVRNTRSIVELLLKRGADINACNAVGETPLHWVANVSRVEIINFLLENGAIIQKDIKGFTPTYVAVENGDKEGLRAFLPKCDVNHQYNGGNTLLHYAAILNSSRIVEILLKNRANVYLMNEDGQSALHEAVYWGHKSVVEVMLRKYPEIVNLVSEIGTTPLQLASVLGNLDIVKMLIEVGADVNVKAEGNCGAVLHFVVLTGYENVVECLLKNKADLNAKTVDGLTPLHLAVQIRARSIDISENSLFGFNKTGNVSCFKMVKRLLKHEAEVNAADKYSKTPLHWAAGVGQHEMVKLLYKYNANLEARDCESYTPLQWAISNGHTQCVMYLLMFGAHALGIIDKHFTDLY